MSSPVDLPIHPAATVVVLRDHEARLEVLLVQRANELAFHGGAWVFPGGRVDAADDHGGDALHTARRAAVREAAEEAGLVLSAEDLVAVSHWTTPRGRSRRFATWFFAVELGELRDIVVDGGEIRAHQWLTPEAALAEQAKGAFELPPPTYVTLSVLAQFASGASALAHFRGLEPIIYVPHQRPTAGGVYSLYDGDIAYDGGDPEQSGPRHRLNMLESGWRYERT